MGIYTITPFRILIVLCIVLVAITVLMWIQTIQHAKSKKKTLAQNNKQYRKRLAEHFKQDPRIALFVIHDNATSNETTDSLAAHCLWNNVVATPYLSHRIVPIIIKICSNDTRVGTPSYAFCKHGQHGKCRLNQKIVSVFGQACCMDVAVSTICIHCPKLKGTGNGFYEPLVGMSYAKRHLDDIGVEYDHVCIVPSTTCMVFGWDKTLIDQLNLGKNNLSGTNCHVVMTCPVRGLQDAVRKNVDHAKKLRSITEAQLNHNNIYGNQSHDAVAATSSGNADFDSNTGTSTIFSRFDVHNTSESLQLYNNICGLAKIEQRDATNHHGFRTLVDGRTLANLLWHTNIPGLWYGCEFADNASGKLVKTCGTFALQKVGHDESPSNTPWWTFGNQTFAEKDTIQTMLSSFPMLLSEDSCVPFDDFEWSCACLCNGFIFVSPLSCLGISLEWTTEALARRAISLPSLTFMNDYINRPKLSQMTGIVLSESSDKRAEAVSPDAPLGLLALRRSDFDPSTGAAKITQVIERSKNHDILARFGLYGAYFSQR